MIVICFKQHLSNTLGPIHDELNNTEPKLKKSASYIKKRV